MGNKMDSCGWDEGRFNEIKEEFQKMLQMIGFKVKKIPFIPYSGFNGDNLVDKTDKAPWYKGWSANINPKKKITGFTIVEAPNNFIVPPKRHPELPVRLPISNILNPSRVSPALLLCRSTLVSSSLDMLPLSSAVPPRLRVR